MIHQFIKKILVRRIDSCQLQLWSWTVVDNKINNLTFHLTTFTIVTVQSGVKVPGSLWSSWSQSADSRPEAERPADSHLYLPAGGALAEGFHERLREFQMFERTFEVKRVSLLLCVSGWTEPEPDLLTFDPAGVHLSVCSEDQVWAAHSESVADHWGHQSCDGRHQHRLRRQEVRKTNFLFNERSNSCTKSYLSSHRVSLTLTFDLWQDLLPGGAGGSEGPAGFCPRTD